MIVQPAGALFPWLDVIGDVHRLAHICPVHIVGQIIAVGSAVVLDVLGPRSVLGMSHTTLVEFDFAIDFGLSISIPFALESRAVVDWSIEIVPIES